MGARRWRQACWSVVTPSRVAFRRCWQVSGARGCSNLSGTQGHVSEQSLTDTELTTGNRGAIIRLIQSRLLRQNGFYGKSPDRSARDEWRNGYGAAPRRVQGNRGGHSAGGR